MGDDSSRLVARARIGTSSGEGVLPRVIPSQGAVQMFYFETDVHAPVRTLLWFVSRSRRDVRRMLQ